jgi:nitrogen fixation protein FixH
MKFNWGTGLVIFFILFIATLGFVLYKSRQHDHSLVIDNYYDEDIKYQEHYNKVRNTTELPVKVKVSYSSGDPQMVLFFPVDSTAGIASGKIKLYNPVTNKADKDYDFQTDAAGRYNIPMQDITSGRWKIKIDWKQAGKEYYQEEEFIK